MNFSRVRTVFSVFETTLFKNLTARNHRLGWKMSTAEASSSSENKYKDYVKFLELVGGLKVSFFL